MQRTTAKQGGWWLAALACSGVLACALPLLRAGSDEPAAAGKNSPAPDALLFRRPAADQSWQRVGASAPLKAGELLLGLPGAGLQSQNGGVELRFLTDLDGTSPYPIREAAVVLHNGPGADLDFTLDRGRVDLVNRKANGPATVGVRVRDKQFELTFEKPGSEVALELYGRWLPGTRFWIRPRHAETPLADLIVLALKGEVVVRHEGRQFRLQAPPGAALIEWDSVHGLDAGPQHLDTLPAWANAQARTATGREKLELLAKFRTQLEANGLEKTFDAFLHSDVPAERRVGVLGLAAVDDLPRLGAVLVATTHEDVWDNAVLALRHWIGRAPGNDRRLFEALVQKRQYSPAQAATVIQLLIGFGAEQQARPETYELLLDLLDSEHLGLRGLAHWHLVRLAPAGRPFGYRPQADKDTRAPAVAEWHKLIPSGELPPRAEPRRN